MNIYFLLNLKNYHVLESCIVPKSDKLSIDYFKFDDDLSNAVYCLDFDDYENNRLFYDERDEIATESELKENYDELIKNNEFDGSFDDYIAECCGKNGTLTPIYKN